MGSQIVYTKAFNSYLRKLSRQKKIVTAVRAAIAEAAMTGDISLPRTKHGETRLASIEKYDLQDGFRLVVQLVDGVAKIRAFLFVGSHDDAERWLDGHRNYRWVRSSNDGTLEFVQVTETKDDRHIPADRVDLETPEDLLDFPLLRVLEASHWATLNLPADAEALAQNVTGHDYERDADGIYLRLDELAGWSSATVVYDILTHAHAGEWGEVLRRLAIHTGEAFVATPAEIIPAMLSQNNSESFIVIDDTTDLDAFFKEHSLAEWMLFLHPEQKRVAERDFRGAARLRGVSGSGKTSVLVHRARHLAKKYRHPVLLVTLTESLRKLIDLLATDLCGVEKSLITTMTVGALAKRVIHELHPNGVAFYSHISTDDQNGLMFECIERARSRLDFAKSPFSNMNSDELRSFFRDEFAFVRGRLMPADFDLYLDAKSFPRHGRGLPLAENGRRLVLEALRQYEGRLSAVHQVDHESIVHEALCLVRSQAFARYRAVLCDEVQDLSQLEVALLGSLRTVDDEVISSADNGLFLAGDGAQSIYKKGFSLRKIGIDVSGRSFLLRKNYRNTSEILRAAFGLVATYEFADVDEENIVKPSEPDFAKRHGSRPFIVICETPAEEAIYVAAAIQSLLALGQLPGQVCVIAPSSWLRGEICRVFENQCLPYAELRQDVDYESERVKVSTIESAKGHEFGSVFIMGLVEGILPAKDVLEGEVFREAARLYVAMTRARDTLTISCSPSAGFPVSRFLHVIQSACDEAQFRDGTLRPVL